MHAGLDPVGVVDRGHGIGAARQYIGARDRVAGVLDRRHLDAEFSVHHLGIFLAVLRRRAEDPAALDIADDGEGLEEGARHAARAQHADGVGILARQVLRPDAGAGADAHVLQVAVVDEGEGLGVLGADQEYEAAVRARLAAVLLLGPVAVGVLGPGDDVGLHADGEEAVTRPFHGAPAEIPVLASARHVDIDPRAVNGAAGGELGERLFLDPDGVLHGQDVVDDVVVDDEHCRASPLSSCPACRATDLDVPGVDPGIG